MEPITPAEAEELDELDAYWDEVAWDEIADEDEET